MRIFISLIIGITLFPPLSYSKVLVIDPGHDYEDVVSGYRTDTEVNTNWEVANMLMDHVYADPFVNWECILTRSENEDNGITVGITERKDIANFIESIYPGEVYFLSIHCNAGGGSAKGTESFYCNHTFNTNN